MINSEDVKTIEETIKDFFQKSSFNTKIEVFLEEENVLIKIKTDEPNILIGEKGQTLSEVQHLLRMILKRKIPSFFHLNVDVNDYKQKKCEYLREMARNVANEVSLSKKEKTLPPMPAYERKVIHLALANRSDVVTESTGQEPERKIIIKPLL